MTDDKALIEEAANSENDWVRARIIKRDAPPEGSLLQIAERARDMAANSLGIQHPAYAVALQNLGLYYEVIQNDSSKADEFFKRARAVLTLPLAQGFYWLGVFHNQVTHDPKMAEPLLIEALGIQRRVLDRDDLQLAETMLALAYAKGAEPDPERAIVLTEEALRIQLVHYDANTPAVADTQRRLDILRALARARSTNGKITKD
jgi:tetratricopeptide (TPR) repeat protein